VFLNLSDFQTSTDAGEAVLTAALAGAQRLWSERLVAAYALGSLAHGGFSEHVSDVDFAVVLSDPPSDLDAQAVRVLADSIKATAAPLSDRLSIFWGSPDSLAGKSPGGRFPPVDRLDLKRHGRLMAGRDVRAQVPVPEMKDMIVAAAQQAAKSMATPEATAQLRNPGPLVQAGARSLTKKVLFPVRFLYTARTGNIGRNDAAVEHFLESEHGPAVELARAAFEWRYSPFAPGDPMVVQQVDAGLLPLYRLFARDYARRLASLGEKKLARAFEEWSRALA
jgi:hypothetical protein